MEIFFFFVFFDGGGFFEEMFFFFGFGFRVIFVEEFESLGGGVFVENVLELGESWGNF